MPVHLVVLVVPICSVLIGTIGYAIGVSWLFWVGVAGAFVNLFLNVASGTYKFPFIAIIAVGVALVFLSPWYFAVGVGLLADAAIDALGELYGRIKGGGAEREPD